MLQYDWEQLQHKRREEKYGQRNRDIFKIRKQGFTLKYIADKYKVTPERIRYIVAQEEAKLII